MIRVVSTGATNGLVPERGSTRPASRPVAGARAPTSNPLKASSPLGLLLAARMLRLFAYGFVGVSLVLYLASLGISEARIGVLLTMVLLGGAGFSIVLSTRADRWGRRRSLVLGAALMLAGGTMMATLDAFPLLVAAGILGVLSPTGGEVGPFLAIEQACLAQLVRDQDRTRIFAWSHVLGFSANAAGALLAGVIAQTLQTRGWSEPDSYRVLLFGYAGCGALLAALFAALPAAVETSEAARGAAPWHGLQEARGKVLRLGALFSLDSLGGGFVVNSFVAYWFHLRFGANVAEIGAIISAATLLSGVSALAAVPLAKRFGLLNTMVFTHLPSNVLLMLVPFMPTLGLAVATLLCRHLIAQMDVPTRQSYVNAIIPAHERSAANGITGTFRQLGTAVGPLLAGPLLAAPGLASLGFIIGGGLKSIYDVAIWFTFRDIVPPEEQHRARAGKSAVMERR